MTIFRKDPMDDILPDTVVKYYLGKITGAGEIGKRVDGNIIPYFTGEDIGVIQSSALLQNFNTSEFKDFPIVENTDWVNIVTSNNTAGTVSKTYGFAQQGDGPLTINWDSISPFNDINNRTTEVNYCNAILDPVTDSELRDNFGWFQIGGDLAVGSPGLVFRAPNEVFSYVSGIRDDPSKSLVTKEEFPSTKFPNSTVNTNLLSLFESIYGSNQSQRDEVFDRDIFSFFSIDGYVQNASDRLDSFLGDAQSYVDYTGGIGIYNVNALSGVLLNYNYARTGLTFTGLNDTPSSLTPDKYLKVNSAGDGFVFADASGGGGSSSGGIGSNSFITGASNFYTDLPDAIVCNYSNTTSKVIFNLDWVGSSHIFYRYVTNDSSNNFKLVHAKFKNDSSGAADGNYGCYQGFGTSSTLANQFSPRLSLSGFLDSDRAVYLGGGSSADGGGGGSCGENGIGPASMSGIAERSNFAGRLPDVIWGTTNNALRTPLYFAEMDMNAGNPDRVYYRPINYPQTTYIEFNNDANGTHRTTAGLVAGKVDGAGNDFSLQQYVSSGYAAFYNYGCGGGGSSSAGDLPVSGLQNNKFLTGSANASNFERDLPDALFVSGVGGALGSLIKVDFIGNRNGNDQVQANNYYMYGRQVNQNLNCRIDFTTLDISGTKIDTDNCSSPYASLAEMIDSGAAIYY